LAHAFPDGVPDDFTDDELPPELRGQDDEG
jgi:hypothetical protein